jgi:VIT1/CCC1 family predicted Fe2+/Mn2+ transporter/rubrerythrin
MIMLEPGETDAIFGAANDIYSLKRMQAEGYRRLAARAGSQRARQLLTIIADEEREDIRFWSTTIESLSGKLAEVNRLLPWRVRLMMIILGARTFLQWAVIAEDVAVETLAIQAGNLADPGAAASWTRIAADERLHIARIKQDVLGMEAWEMGGGGGVRDVIFGANDGLVSILALVAGVFGAVTDSRVVLIAGVAGAVAGTVSMGAGAYVSSKSEQEVVRKEESRKGGQRASPQEKKAELVKEYEASGFEPQTAAAIADRVADRMEEIAEYDIGAETGLSSDNEWPPAKAGLLTGLSFFVASLIPILPFIFLDVQPAAILAIVGSVLAMFLVGASKAIFTRQSWLRSGLEVMVVGMLAAAATYLIGLAIPI